MPSTAQRKSDIVDINSEAQVASINPATGETINHYTRESREAANQAIEESHKAFLSWRHIKMQQRVKIITDIAAKLEESRDELAKMMTTQMGKPLAQSQSEIDLCISICHYTAEHGPALLKDEERSSEQGDGIISYEPIGVILAMQPWNFPLYQVVRYSIPNILAGNTTVLKHSEIVWGTALRIQELYEAAGLPENVFRVICVDNETADELIGHEKVRGVTMTGSNTAGKIIAEAAGKYLKKSVLELGGSDPYIVLEDTNIDEILDACVMGRINNGGQTCIAAKRFIVVAEKYDEFKDKFVAAMSAVKYGDPLDEANQMGSMSSEDARDKLHEQVKEAIEKGATCLTGCEIPEGDGYFYPPSVLENVEPGSPAYDGELFGPVAVLFKATDEDDAVRIANDHIYGLGGGVFSSDQTRAIQVAKRIETGMVNINGYGLARPNMPFGGVKQSGYGREHGGFGIREFVNIKAILLPSS